MAQSSALTVFAADLGKAASALVRSYCPRARIIRRRLSEMSASGTSRRVIGKAWATDRQASPNGLAWVRAV